MARIDIGPSGLEISGCKADGEHELALSVPDANTPTVATLQVFDALGTQVGSTMTATVTTGSVVWDLTPWLVGRAIGTYRHATILDGVTWLQGQLTVGSVSDGRGTSRGHTSATITVSASTGAVTVTIPGTAAAQALVDAEATIRAAADTALDARLDAIEADYLTSTDLTGLASSSALSAETSARQSADTALDGRLDAIEADYSTSTEVATAVAAETTRATTAEGALDGRLDAIEGLGPLATDAEVTAAVGAEATIRAAADTALDARLDTLEADPTTGTAVAAVAASVTTEAGTRASADTALDSRLDAIEADYTTSTELATAISNHAGASDPHGDRAYVIARAAAQGDNLWPDGFLTAGTLTTAHVAYGTWTRSTSDAIWAPASAYSSTAYGLLAATLPVTVDAVEALDFAVWSRCTASGELFLIGVQCFDADGLTIEPQMAERFNGAAVTTLAVALNPGDTTVTLTDGTGWATGADPDYFRRLGWWPYVSVATGRTYDTGYTRNTSANGTWASRSGNVLTLAAPWAGPALAIGTPIANMAGGNSYSYAIVANGSTTWTKHTGGVAAPTGVNDGTARLRLGTAAIKPVILGNYSGGTGQWFSAMTFRRA